MSSTNKTTNYELSQYVGSDKPTYLGDYNSDMLKIDTQMKNNADNITAVGATANTANTTAGTALTNAATAQTTADNASTSASNASSVANQALSKANSNEANITKLSNTDTTNITITWESNVTSHVNTRFYRYGNLLIFNFAFNVNRPSQDWTGVKIATLNKNIAGSFTTNTLDNHNLSINAAGEISFTKLDATMPTNAYIIAQLVCVLDDSQSN